MDHLTLSRAGYEEIQQRLHRMKTVEMMEIAQKIKDARELGDLSENAEYHSAREEQALLQASIERLEQQLRHAVIIEDAPEGAATGQVQFGSTIEVEDIELGERMTFRLVGTLEANIMEGKISTVSPLGAAVLGRRAGDEVEVEAPAGTIRYRLHQVS